MSWDEIGKTTIRQARILNEHFNDVDGVAQLIDYVNSALGGKPQRRRSEPERSFSKQDQALISRFGGIVRD